MKMKEPTTIFKDRSPDHRLAELMLYVAKKSSGDHWFGATKLNKLLWFADFLSFSKTGTPITGAEYIKEKNGPVPKRLLPIRKKLVDSGEAAIQKVSCLGGEQHRLVHLREPNLSDFTGEEISFVDDVIDWCENQSANDVSKLSHNRIWRVSSMGDSIPYEAVFVSDEDATDEDAKDAQKLIKTYKWAV